VLTTLETRIHRDSFDLWFQPIAFVRDDGAAWELSVPNYTFQVYIPTHYGDLLRAAIHDVLGEPRQIHFSIRALPLLDSPPFDVVQAAQLETACGQNPWLIDQLWMSEAVGILGGPPRAYKTWLALEMAVSVASGQPCLGMFPVPQPGPVLLYAAEDSASSLRSRLESIARVRNSDFNHLDVRVITADRLRLDQSDDQQRFRATLAIHQPRLVILDPLVRIHCADENASNAVAALLGYFRALQRCFHAAILLIHHSRKDPSAGSGLSLRGSSDFYAWTDSLLFLQRRRDQHHLLSEHRAAPASGPFTIELVSGDAGPHLQLHAPSADVPSNPNSLAQTILDLLSKSAQPLPTEKLRSAVGVRKQRLLETLRTLVNDGKIIRGDEGYLLKPSQ
jgi:hypothetical protein